MTVRAGGSRMPTVRLCGKRMQRAPFRPPGTRGRIGQRADDRQQVECGEYFDEIYSVGHAHIVMRARIGTGAERSEKVLGCERDDGFSKILREW